MFWQVILGGLGASLILTRTVGPFSVFYRLRQRWSIFRCSACCGFWLGLGLGKYFMVLPFALLAAFGVSAIALLISLQYPPLHFEKRNNANDIHPPIKNN
jgi:hypothetical protein